MITEDYISGIRKELLSIEDNAKDINGLTESQWVSIRAAHRLLGEYVEKEQKSSIVEKLRKISTPADENWFEIQKRWEKEDEQKPYEPKNWPADKDNLTQEQKPVEKHNLVAQLKEYLTNTPKEQLEAKWKELEKWNNVGPTVEEYLCGIKPAEWSEEDEKSFDNALSGLKYAYEDLINHNSFDSAQDVKNAIDWLKVFRPQSKDEIYKEKDEAFKLGKHQLAIKFMNYLDENRPEGKMSLSNAECEDIDKAFKENDWERIMRYVNKYAWKPSKEQVEALEDTMTYIPEYYKPKSNLASLLRDLKKQI